jgi:hypothetical protein
VALKDVEQISRELRKNAQAHVSSNKVIVANRQKYLRQGRARRGAVDGEARGRDQEIGAPVDEPVLQWVELANASTRL